MDASSLDENKTVKNHFGYVSAHFILEKDKQFKVTLVECVYNQYQL